MVNQHKKLDTIVNFARRKGIVYPSSEIYGGYTGIYDFGPLGFLLKQNLLSLWRWHNVDSRLDMVEIDGSIFMHPKVWEASGHTSGFSDMLTEDIKTKKRYRADHLIEEAGLVKNAGGLSEEQMDKLIKDNDLLSPDGNALGPVKKFNLMVKTHLGASEDNSSIAYLKGESCQNIYIDFKAVQETTRLKLPFGIAQVGKAFRNEISPRQFIFRLRELEQMDVQYFCHPSESSHLYQDYIVNRQDFYHRVLGINQDHIRLRRHEEDERAFYALDAWDIEYSFGSLGFKEIEGIHNRSDYDLKVHGQHSGEDLSYFDPFTRERFLPYVIECSAGLNRLMLMLMFEFYDEQDLGDGDMRIVWHLPYDLSPYKVAVLPLMKKDDMVSRAKEITKKLISMGIKANYDDSGSIGKRYRRQDESGTAWCLTVDHDSLSGDINDASITLRHRDSMEQVGAEGRVSLSNLTPQFLKDNFSQ
jgi:glycyl-tRNA synthetase